MSNDAYLVASGVLGAVGLFAYYKYRQHSQESNISSASQAGISRLPDAVDKLSVLNSHTLIARLDLNKAIGRLQNRSGFERNIFETDYLPVIHTLAEWCQLLPASESHHHAQPGGLLVHILETAEFALQARQGYLLPAGAAPEELPARKHRWTYGVFVAALLHDIGKLVADLRIPIFDEKQRAIGYWQPLAGSMSDQNITYYQVAFDVDNKDYALHQKLPIILMQRLLPDTTLSWLAKDRELMQELTMYLSGDAEYQGILKKIITASDSESVKRNLLNGSRTRFSSAKTTPLIERLMQALRMMLDEGLLNLNRAGAHGWVYDNKMWFVSKRIADAVRDFIIERESKEGIPGKDKNDRLFDTWQEYGAIIETPDFKAIWSVNIVLDDGWNQNMTVLCFPLDKLYKHPDLYPAPVRGKITPIIEHTSTDAVIKPVTIQENTGAVQNTHAQVIAPDLAKHTDVNLPDIIEPDFIPESALQESSPTNTTNTDAVTNNTLESVAGNKPVNKDKPKKKKPEKAHLALPAINLKTLMQSTDNKSKIAPIKEPEPIPRITEPVDSDMDTDSMVEIVEPDDSVIQQKQEMAKVILELDTLLAEKRIASPNTTSTIEDDDDFLDDFDSVVNKKSLPEAATLKPVSPAGQKSFNPSNSRWNTQDKPISEAALRFMRWIQEGLAQGTMPYNRPDALIHFMDEGMMLVSPKIFREFAQQFGENGDGKPTEQKGVAVGTGIQRHVTNAGWHQQVGTDKRNIQKFRVVGHNGEGKQLISGVLILNPEHFVNPVPEKNPSIKAMSLD